MQENFDFFAGRYASAVKWTVGTFIAMISVSVISFMGADNASISEINERIETARWLQARMEHNRNSNNLDALDEDNPADARRKKAYSELIAYRGAPFRTHEQVGEYLAELEKQRESLGGLLGINIFGVQLEKDSVIVKRWIALLFVSLLFVLALSNEKDKTLRGYAVAQSGARIALLYEKFAVCQGILLSVPKLDDPKPTRSFRNWVVMSLFFVPLGAFLCSVIQGLYRPGFQGLKEGVLAWNFILTCLFVAILIWQIVIYWTSLKFWGTWWSAARFQRYGEPLEGRWRLSVKIDEEEFGHFAHSGELLFRDTEGGLEIDGFSDLKDPKSSEEVRRPWSQSYVLKNGEKLVCFFRFSYMGQEIDVMCKVNVSDPNSKQIDGYYYQLRPAHSATFGQVRLERPESVH